MFHSAPKLNRKCNLQICIGQVFDNLIIAGFILNFFFAHIFFVKSDFTNFFTDFRALSSFFIYGNDHLDRYTCRISRQERTLSCLKKRIILSSRKTRLELTKLWKTFGSFLSATRFPSLGSVTDQTTPNAPYPIGRSGV